MTARLPPAISPRPHPLPPSGDPAFDSAGYACTLLRTARVAALATLDAGSGYPFASTVAIATDMDGTPLMLISRVALHTRNILADPRVSLLPVPAGEPIRAGSGRLTLTGTAHRAEDARSRRRFLACHPKLTLPAGLPGFAIWRIALDGVDLLGGKRLAPELTAADMLTDLRGAEALAAEEADLAAWLNAAHAGAIRHLAVVRAGQAEGPWRVACLDPEGIDIRLGDQHARIALPHRATGRDDLLSAVRALTDAGDRMPRLST